jgi:hypothetical protein
MPWKHTAKINSETVVEGLLFSIDYWQTYQSWEVIPLLFRLVPRRCDAGGAWSTLMSRNDDSG